MIWLGPDDHPDAGDRRLELVVPPIFDGPTTRALFDERTGVLWAVGLYLLEDWEACTATGCVVHQAGEDLSYKTYRSIPEADRPAVDSVALDTKEMCERDNTLVDASAGDAASATLQTTGVPLCTWG